MEQFRQQVARANCNMVKYFFRAPYMHAVKFMGQAIFRYLQHFNSDLNNVGEVPNRYATIRLNNAMNVNDFKTVGEFGNSPVRHANAFG